MTFSRHLCYTLVGVEDSMPDKIERDPAAHPFERAERRRELIGGK